MSGFSNTVLGGASRLVRTAIQSFTYIPGTSGWSINKNGSAEFNNVTVRGTIIAGQFIGTGEGKEILIYSGTPAANNLLLAITSAGFTDSFGNVGFAGLNVYQNTGGTNYVLFNLFNQELLTLLSTVGENTWTSVSQIISAPSGISLVSQNAGIELRALNGLISLVSSSATTGGLRVNPGLIVLNNLAANPSSVLAVTAGQLFSNTGGNPGWVNQNYIGAIPIDLTDTSTNTNLNQAGATRISAVYTIPANDANVGTIYELEVPIEATMEGNTLEIGLSIDGSTSFTVNATLSGTIVGAGIGLNGIARVIIYVTATGVTGKINAYMDGSLNQNGAQTSFSNTATLSGSRAIGVTLDTTASHTVRVNTLWGAANVSETVSGIGSRFTRRGP